MVTSKKVILDASDMFDVLSTVSAGEPKLSQERLRGNHVG